VYNIVHICYCTLFANVYIIIHIYLIYNVNLILRLQYKLRNFLYYYLKSHVIGLNESLALTLNLIWFQQFSFHYF